MKAVLPKGSSGSWVINADRTKLYGVIVATDCFGGLWMVRMTNIMDDILKEFNAAGVSFESHFGSTDAHQGVTTKQDVREEPTASDSEEPLVSPSSDLIVTVSQDYDNSEVEENTSLISHPEKSHTPAMKPSGISTIPSSFPGIPLGQSKEIIWLCSNCGDGPIGIWQSCCTSCGHAKCGACMTELV
jgi:hypothetical protein